MSVIPRAAIFCWTLGVLGLGLWSTHWLDQRTRTTLEWQLRERANWSAAWYTAHTQVAPVALQNRLVALTESVDPFGTVLRVTILTPDGRRVADSVDAATIGVAIHDAPDVLAAQARGVGAASDVTGDWCVTKAAIDEGVLRGYVRVCMPAVTVARTAQRQTQGMLAGGAVIWSLGLMGLFRRRWWQRVVHRAAALGTAVVPVEDATANIEHALLDCLPDGVVMTDANERISYCNAAAQALLGVDPASVAGRYYWEVIRWPELHMLVQAARGTAGVVERTVRVRVADTEHRLHVRVQSVGTAFGMTLHDVTAMRRLERIRRDFVANVSHELQTPLMALTGYLELLRDDLPPDDSAARQWVEKMAAQAERLQVLVRSLLSLARAEAMPEPMLVPTDLVPLARDAVARWQEVAQRKDLTLALDVADSACLVEVDPDSMLQVLDNLIANAVQWTSQGRVVVRVAQSASCTTVAVTDTGAGIPIKDQSRVFERFYQVDPSRRPQRSGTGLGLAIVKHLVHTQHGTIHLDSTEGIGSTFTVTFIKS